MEITYFDHLLLGRVVGEESGVVVEDEPAVLPALHDVGPLGQRTLQHFEASFRSKSVSEKDF